MKNKHLLSHCIYVGKFLLFVTPLRSIVQKTKFVHKTSNLMVPYLYNCNLSFRLIYALITECIAHTAFIVLCSKKLDDPF